jgi:hypothetical protein
MPTKTNLNSASSPALRDPMETLSPSIRVVSTEAISSVRMKQEILGSRSTSFLMMITQPSTLMLLLSNMRTTPYSPKAER